jgi:hypothetical protein
MIYRRFGLSNKKSRRALQRIHEITAKHNCTPSFFITAELLDKHLDIIKEISVNGTHMGLHGYHHIDYCLMSGKAQSDDIAKGLEKFRRLGLPVSGFRAPFLRFNDETSKAAAENGVNWVSHSTMLFDGNSCLDLIDGCGNAQQLLGGFYTTRSQVEEPSLPSWGPSYCLEIPVSLPDDELMVDRLGIHVPEELTAIWLDMLHSSLQKGELFNFIFHPERIDLVAEPLIKLLKEATRHSDLWLCSLEEINHWWRERSIFTFEIHRSNSDTFKVSALCTARASIAVQHPGGRLEYISPEPNGKFVLQSNLKPVVGVRPGCKNTDIHYLENEGFVVDQVSDPSECAFVLDGTFSGDSRQLLNSLDQAQGPLLRFWRWPDRYKSALAITADIDAITIWDFFRRARHFSKHRA